MSKINLFEDKEYDRLDWLNKAVEPYIFPQNDIISQMPTEIEVTFEDVWKFFLEEGFSAHIGTMFVVNEAAKKLGIFDDINHDTMQIILKLYSFEIDPNAEINLETKTMTGWIKCIKSKNQLEDEDIVSYMADKISGHLMYLDPGSSDLGRMNEVLDLIGANKSRASRSFSNKRKDIQETMREIITGDKWRVRNVELMVKCGQWMKSYIQDGNLAAMSNFTRLKCMVHKGAPIYSMEETR